jgi:hypothetical protein
MASAADTLRATSCTGPHAGLDGSLADADVAAAAAVTGTGEQPLMCNRCRRCCCTGSRARPPPS